MYGPGILMGPLFQSASDGPAKITGPSKASSHNGTVLTGLKVQ